MYRPSGKVIRIHTGDWWWDMTQIYKMEKQKTKLQESFARVSSSADSICLTV